MGSCVVKGSGGQEGAAVCGVGREGSGARAGQQPAGQLAPLHPPHAPHPPLVEGDAPQAVQVELQGVRLACDHPGSEGWSAGRGWQLACH